MTWVEARLWRRLPVEIVERVRSFLPVRDLCRCSTVCKRWKHLISTPEFGSLCFRNSEALGRCYIVARYVVKPEPLLNETRYPSYQLGWSILDMETKRWYTFKQLERPEFYGHGFGQDLWLLMEVLCVNAGPETLSHIPTIAFRNENGVLARCSSSLGSQPL